MHTAKCTLHTDAHSRTGDFNQQAALGYSKGPHTVGSLAALCEAGALRCRALLGSGERAMCARARWVARVITSDGSLQISDTGGGLQLTRVRGRNQQTALSTACQVCRSALACNQPPPRSLDNVSASTTLLALVRQPAHYDAEACKVAVRHKTSLLTPLGGSLSWRVRSVLYSRRCRRHHGAATKTALLNAVLQSAALEPLANTCPHRLVASLVTSGQPCRVGGE
jgi:hypothetical protein